MNDPRLQAATFLRELLEAASDEVYALVARNAAMLEELCAELEGSAPHARRELPLTLAERIMRFYPPPAGPEPDRWPDAKTLRQRMPKPGDPGFNFGSDDPPL